LPLPAILGNDVRPTIFFLAVCLAGCFGNESTEFPTGLEPLEDNVVPPHEGDTFEETIAYADGDSGSYAWVHGRGFVLAAPADVWRAIETPELMVATCATDTQEIAADVEPDYEVSFQVSYTVEKLITVAWDELWRYGTIDGTQAAPALGMVRYQKVYGSTLIDLLEGSIQLHATTDPSVTELELIEHLAGAGGTADDMRASMQHRFDSVVSVVRGGDPPPCP